MTAVLTKTKLVSTPHNNIYSFLNNRSYIPDPRDTNNTGLRTFIYESDPFSKGLNFGDFPYIILKFPTMKYSKVSCDSTTKEIEWKHEIIVRAVKDGASNSHADIGRTELLDIEDSLHYFFNTRTYRQLLQNVNIYFPTLIKVSQDDIVLNQQNVYESKYDLTYLERFKVSD